MIIILRSIHLILFELILYLSGNDIILDQIRLDDTILIQKRTYAKISDILSRIGGYMQLMYTVFLLLANSLNKIDCQLKI